MPLTDQGNAGAHSPCATVLCGFHGSLRVTAWVRVTGREHGDHIGGEVAHVRISRRNPKNHLPARFLCGRDFAEPPVFVGVV
jgi:hypothetical protein